jgi:hypothetical protein
MTYSFNRTYIFTFDSLGSPQALKRLSSYLMMEAKVKKGVEIVGIVEGQAALVPILTSPWPMTLKWTYLGAITK